MNRGHTHLLFVGLLLTSSTAWGQIGPPQLRAPDDGYSLGVAIHNVHSRWSYGNVIDRNRIYLEGSRGLADCLEVFARVGGSEWVVNDIETFQPGFTRDVSSDGYPAFLSGGLRALAWDCDQWSIGVSFEAAIYSSMERSVRWDFDTYQEIHFDSTVEINAGISIGYRCSRSTFYAGPLLHLGYASADVRTHTFGPDWNVQDSIDAVTIRDKPGWGAFVGWLWPFGDSSWSLQLEGSVLRDGVGGSIACFKSW